MDVRTILGGLALALLLAGGGYARGCSDERGRQALVLAAARAETARLADSATALRIVIADLAEREARIDTVWRTQLVPAWRAVEESLMQVPDTASLPVPQVKAIVATGSAAVTACTTLVATCQLRAANLQLLAGVLERKDSLNLQRIGDLTRQVGRARREGMVLGIGVAILGSLVLSAVP